MPEKTLPFYEARYITSPEGQAELLAEAFESGDPGYIANALGIIARARGMSQVARDAGVMREALYKALSGDGDPKLSTVLGVAKALGLKLSARPAQRLRLQGPCRGRSRLGPDLRRRAERC